MFALSAYNANQAPTLSRQHELARLPIPTLEASTQRYLESLKPFLLQQAQEAGLRVEQAQRQLEKRHEWANDFLKEGGLGRLLQERLKDVDRSSPNNWLDDNYWLSVYHGWRAALPINSNWFILMADDQAIPKEVRASAPPQGEYSNWQIKRGAKLVERLIQFKHKLDREEIAPDASRAGPFCMHQYTRVYGVTRLPGLPLDKFVHAPHPHPSAAITVIVNDHFYNVPVTTADGQAVNLASLEATLWAIVDDASARPRGPSVGACSGDGRDAWTVSREHLLQLDPKNRATMTAIENSLFVLALDGHTLKSPSYQSSSTVSQTPDLDAHIVNGSSAGGEGRNRWWDKAITVAVESNGRAIMNGEHSPCDALIPSIIAEYVLAEGVSADETSHRGQGSLNGVQKLNWVLDAQAEKNIEGAIQTISDLAGDSEGKMLWYDEYGTEWIKKVGKQSPDAYCQMALQLAYHRTHGRCVGTYETASTRLFLHGRTDVIRTFSEDSLLWVQAMRQKDQYSPIELYELLTAATKAHNSYKRDSSTGKGLDRHFLGLQQNLREGESHPLFEDPLFTESQSWVLSTSGLSAGDRFYGTGFGTPWPNGYGINYLAGSKIIKFGIESKRSDPHTSTEVFRNNLSVALRDMKEVCEKGQPVAEFPAAPAKL
ncbi:hypothetical protein MVLG_02376 [Microbotryum lychnidis-dioicae p1A1 Lamole]|uniref:Choline/carnitine acyltransferase domain-containing protein n=1 Tax=Microbotryum lychnidis-dioicae (strain p1A1 Lamole / MvSl-1064) TaxID=683840 RepID=U5H4Z5_USTV1|nr:hypothetical protein MVLG_02376 [Microbotryum lychnidis-dioicae p1A1 Lamole]|eukprot:KDE07333.1 hypothetical protein MVLG_02376 [Microbotryum lychnidis-dioicae p1A1 Lamole]